MITLVTFGKMKSSPDYAGLDALCHMYLKRVQPWCPVQLIELPESTPEREATTLAPYLAKASRLLLWTEHGQTMASPGWSAFVQQQRDTWGFSAASPWVWVLAGPAGPDPTLVAQANHTISLSPMTFPHLLARVLVLEQLYRALAMQHGVAYHK
jgi:23S rRNA (pseudouridine1915-N3)-methyltransferase